MEPNGVVIDPSSFQNQLGESEPAVYIVDYLNEINVKTGVVENDYVDKDFLIDYQKFYSRSYKKHQKFCTRIHFFSNEFDSEYLRTTLEANDKIKIKELNASYLGFVVQKKIKDIKGNYMIGRTLLKTYDKDAKDGTRVYTKNKNSVSFFGIDLSIESLPYQTQDQGVSACATIALWTALESVTNIYDIERHSPAEITEDSNSFPSAGRIYPQSGLTYEQMIKCIRNYTLDAELIDVEGLQNDVIIKAAIKAYSKLGIPLIAMIKLKGPIPEEDDPDAEKIDPDDFDYHAVVITGFKTDASGDIIELYVHDDQIGPYSKVFPDGNFKEWKNKWSRSYQKVIVEELMVPLYHKIRLDFSQMYSEYENIVERFTEKISEGVNYDFELFLTTIQDYKADLLDYSVDDKFKVLTKSMPRFLWIIRYCEEGLRSSDAVFDATSRFPKDPTEISYTYS